MIDDTQEEDESEEISSVDEEASPEQSQFANSQEEEEEEEEWVDENAPYFDFRYDWKRMYRVAELKQRYNYYGSSGTNIGSGKH